jgi:uncharacterized protein YoaH (UPF0181 family)
MYDEKAVELAPLIFEKSKLDEGIAALEVEKAKADDALVGGIDEQIAELNQQKESINGQIQSIITPSEVAGTQEAGTAIRQDEAGVGIDGDGVQEVGNAGVQEEVAQPLRDVESTAKALEGKDIENIIKPKNTKIVDENGNPLKLYHVSENEIKGDIKTVNDHVLSWHEKRPENDKKLYQTDKDGNYTEIGFHLGGEETIKDFTERYGITPKTKLSVFLDINNPVEIKDLAAWTPTNIVKELDNMGYDAGKLKDKYTASEALEILKKLRIDGFKYENIYEYSGEKYSYMAIHPEQVIVIDNNKVAEAYHKAKADGSNPKLVKAVESLLSKEQTKQDTKGNEGQVGQGGQQLREGQEQVTPQAEVTNANEIAEAEGVSVGEQATISQEVREGNTQEQEATQEGEGQKVMNFAANREITSAIESDNMPEFRKSIKEAIKGATKEKADRELFNKAANKQLANLINKANTPEQAQKAVEYIDKLMANANFRNALNEAAENLETRKKQLQKLAGAESILSAVSSINPSGIKSLELLQKTAKILSSNNIDRKELGALMFEIRDHMVAQTRADGLATKEGVGKAINNLTTKKGKDKDGNTIIEAKELDSPRKIKSAARRVGRIEEAINSLKDVTEEERTELLDALEKSKEEINNASDKLATEMEAARKQNIESAKEYMQSAEIKKDLSADGGAIYESYIEPIVNDKDALAAMDNLSFYDSERLSDALSFAQDGLLPLGFFRAFTQPLTGVKQLEAVNEIVDGGLTTFGQDVAKMRKNGYNQAKKMMFGYANQRGGSAVTKPPTKKTIEKMLDVAYAADLDSLFKKGKEALLNKYFVLPLSNSFNNFQETRSSFLTEFERPLGITFSALPNLVKKKLPFAKDKVSSLNKIGAYLLQRRFEENQIKDDSGKIRNPIKINLELSVAKEGSNQNISSSIDEEVMGIWEQLNEKYPNGITEKDLTPSELKIAEAFDKLVSRLEKLQRIANYRRGLPFNAVDFYAPMLSASGRLRFTTSKTDQEQTSFNDAIDLIDKGQGQSYKNVRLKSDRGLDSDPNASPFVMITNVADMAWSMTNDVLKDYFIFPEVYSAQKSFNTAAKQETAKTKSAETLSNLIKSRYKDILVRENLKFTSPLFIGIKKIISASQIEFLYNLRRFVPELVAGFVFTASSPYVTSNPTLFPKAILDTFRTSGLVGDGTFKIAVELAEEGAYGKFLEAELTGKEKFLEAAGKAFRTISSPDSFQETGLGRALFILTMKAEFKKATGKSLSMSKLKDEAYLKENKDALKDASKRALIESKLMVNSSFGRPLRPYYIGGASLDASKSDLGLLAETASYFLGGWVARTGRRFWGLTKDTITGSNYGHGQSAAMLALVVSSAVIYQLTRDSQNYVEAALMGDDEEEKQAAIEFERTVASPEYRAAQYASSILFLSTGPFGSLGKAMTFGTGDLLIRVIEADAIRSGKSVVETKILTDNIKEFVKDATYQLIPPSKTQSLDKTYKIAAGGLAVAAEQGVKFWDSAKDLAVGLYNREPVASDALYAVGTAWNMAYGQRIPVPFLAQMRKSVKERQEDVDKAVRDYKKDKRNQQGLIDEVIKKYAVESLENKITPSQATEKIYQELHGYMPDVPKRELNKKIKDKFDDYTTPLFLKKIDGKPDLFEKGAAAASELKRISNSTDANAEADLKTLSKYISKKKNGDSDDVKEFMMGFNSVKK